MITIIYSNKENIPPILDCNIPKFIDKIKDYQKNNIDYITEVGNELVIAAVRASIKTKDLDYKNIEFVYNNLVLPPNKHARLDYWPDGFCAHNDKYMDILLGL